MFFVISTFASIAEDVFLMLIELFVDWLSPSPIFVFLIIAEEESSSVTEPFM